MSEPVRPPETDRQAWMAALCGADWPILKACWGREDPKPAYSFLRRPETGLVMLRGRMGGTGAPFNFGEATVTRCSVRLGAGATGHAYVMGRNHAHAEIAAVYDALMQLPEHRTRVGADVIEPLVCAQDERRRKTMSEAAATRVDFFTMVRGED